MSFPPNSTNLATLGDRHPRRHPIPGGGAAAAAADGTGGVSARCEGGLSTESRRERREEPATSITGQRELNEGKSSTVGA